MKSWDLSVEGKDERDDIRQLAKRDGLQPWMMERFQDYPRSSDVYWRKLDNTSVMHGVDSGIHRIGYVFTCIYGVPHSGPYFDNPPKWEKIEVAPTVPCAECLTAIPLHHRDYLCRRCRV